MSAPSQTGPTVAICGRGRVAVDALQHAVVLNEAGVAPATVVACPSGGDTGEDDWSPSLVRAARELGIPTADVDDLAERPELVLLSLEYDRILRVDAFASRRLYNLHFSALPAYRGVYTSIWPILRGETYAGVTLHQIDAGVDTGAIVAQRTFPLASRETARTLFERFHSEASVLVHAWYVRLVAGPVASTPQPAEGASTFLRASLDIETQRALNLTMTADELDRRTRAFYFPEYQTAVFQNRPVVRCHRVSPPVGDTQAAGVIAETERSTLVSAADRTLVELVHPSAPT